MKDVLSTLLLLLVIYPAFAQDRAHPNECRLESKYDQSADTTTIKCLDLIKWGEAPARLTIHAAASFKGHEPNQSARLWLILSSNRSDSTREAPLLFKQAVTIHLALDSGELEIPVSDYSTDFFEMNRLRAESAHAVICIDDLQKVLNSRNLAGKWGTVDFKFSDRSLASLKDFIAHNAIAPLAH